MGIDVYACWRGQTKTEQHDRDAATFDVTAGRFGYLREAYHGGPYATRVLLPECFGEDCIAQVRAATLRERLPAVLATAIERNRRVYKCAEASDETLEICDSFNAFVELCEHMEAKSGQPCWFEASW